MHPDVRRTGAGQDVIARPPQPLVQTPHVRIGEHLGRQAAGRRYGMKVVAGAGDNVTVENGTGAGGGTQHVAQG